MELEVSLIVRQPFFMITSTNLRYASIVPEEGTI